MELELVVAVTTTTVIITEITTTETGIVAREGRVAVAETETETGEREASEETKSHANSRIGIIRVDRWVDEIPVIVEDRRTDVLGMDLGTETEIEIKNGSNRSME